MASKKPEYPDSVGRLLGFASTASNLLADRRLKEHGITLHQWIPMTALWRQSPMSESELAEYCRMSASALNRLLDRMESKELVRRKADPNDQRRVLVDVGKQGKKLSHLLSFHDQTNKTLLKGMNKTEEQQLVKLLERVIENINFELGEDH